MSDMMDEHAPRGTDEKGVGSSYEPTPEDKKAIKLAESLFDKAKKYRSQYDDKWLDFYRMFRGRQWKEQRPSYRHSEVINLIFRTIQGTIPLQVDARPRFEFQPEEPSDQEVAAILNECAEADWVNKAWSEQLLEVIYDANFYGTGISSMLVKGKPEFPEIDYASADPFHCFPDPSARDTHKECGYFVHAEPMDIRRIKKKYPHVKDFLKPDLVDFMKSAKTDSAPFKYKSPVDSRTVVDSSGHADLIEKDKALLITVWITPEFCEDDYEEIKVDGVDPDTGEPTEEFEQRNKYPRGRKIVLCNKVLCEDGDAGYEDGEIPFSRYVNYLLPREFWGMSEVEQLEGPQKSFNKLVSFALDVLTLMGNPVWMIHTNSGVNPENLVNRPGLVVEGEWEPGQEPKRVEGVQLQPYVLQLIDRMGQWFDDVGGDKEVSRGAQPTGVTAAKAISTLQEAAQTRIRQKQRNLDNYLQHVGRQYASRFFQFMSAPRVFRLTGEGSAMRYFKAHVEDVPAQPDQMLSDGSVMPGTPATRKLVVQGYGPSGALDPMQQRELEIKSKMDVRVSTGSSLPFAKEEKEAKLLQLFDRGIIDREEVLKGAEYPNWEAVLQRLEQKEAAAAQAEQEAAMAAEQQKQQGQLQAQQVKQDGDMQKQQMAAQAPTA